MIKIKKEPLIGLIVIAVAVYFFMLPQSDAVANNELAISTDNYTGDWPFTDESGVIGCIDKATYFDTGDDVYALSGFSRAYSDNKGLGWLPVTPEQPFWLDNPEIEGTKVNVSSMISDAMELCD